MCSMNRSFIKRSKKGVTLAKKKQLAALAEEATKQQNIMLIKKQTNLVKHLREVKVQKYD